MHVLYCLIPNILPINGIHIKIYHSQEQNVISRAMQTVYTKNSVDKMTKINSFKTESMQNIVVRMKPKNKGRNCLVTIKYQTYSLLTVYMSKFITVMSKNLTSRTIQTVYKVIKNSKLTK